MQFIIAFLFALFFAPALAIPGEGAVKQFLGIGERDIDVSKDPRDYKPRRWLKPEERWGHLPTSTLGGYPWHHPSGAPQPTGGHKPPGYPGQGGGHKPPGYPGQGGHKPPGYPGQGGHKPPGYPGNNDPWPFPFPNPFHHHKGQKPHHKLPFPFDLLPWPLNQLSMDQINHATPEQKAALDAAIADAKKGKQE